MHIHIHIHTYIHTYAYTYAYTYTYTYTYTYAYTYTYTYTYTYIHTHKGCDRTFLSFWPALVRNRFFLMSKMDSARKVMHVGTLNSEIGNIFGQRLNECMYVRMHACMYVCM